MIEESNGKKMWKEFSCLKSELVNHWLPHFTIQSGWDIDDAVERARIHAWAHRANKNIKKMKRKALLAKLNKIQMEGEELKFKIEAEYLGCMLEGNSRSDADVARWLAIARTASQFRVNLTR